jgi:hypothetical protein
MRQEGANSSLKAKVGKQSAKETAKMYIIGLSSQK